MLCSCTRREVWIAPNSIFFKHGTMAFYPANFQPPPQLVTSKFQLYPLTPAYLELDYAAVMAGREVLNVWSGSSWPTPDFTLGENLADLQWHEREHKEGAAFTFTILSPAASVCLGCLYIRPLSELRPTNPSLLADSNDQDAMARFWLLESPLDPNLERDLLAELINWFNNDWHFPHLYFHTRPANGRQVQLFDTFPLTRQFELQMVQRGGSHIFWRSVG